VTFLKQQKKTRGHKINLRLEITEFSAPRRSSQQTHRTELLTRGGKKERRAVRREGKKKLTYSRLEAAPEEKRQNSRCNLLLADIVEAAQLEERATSLSKDFREAEEEEEEEEEDSRMLSSFVMNLDFASDVQ
jgi:hypothetical protein